MLIASFVNIFNRLKYILDPPKFDMPELDAHDGPIDSAELLPILPKGIPFLKEKVVPESLSSQISLTRKFLRTESSYENVRRYVPLGVDA